MGAGRLMIALAGPPASGKSTRADQLVQDLRDRSRIRAQVVPMDGFHFDNAILEERGVLSRKGAPYTFDVAGLASLLKRLSTSFEIEDVAVPLFDRELELSRAGARIIHGETNVVVVEGNYLLLNEDPWRHLRAYFDLTALIVCDEEVLGERLVQRWRDFGYAPDRARAWIDSNDMPNIRTVINGSGAVDFHLN